MSIIYGKQSRYLVINDLIYFLKEKFILIIGIILLFLLLQIIPQIKSLNGIFIIIIIIIIIKNVVDIKSDNYRKISDKYYHGRMGEYDISDELQILPDDYLIFQDVHLPNSNWNIDSVVIGPTGIYTIEVKSHKGRIGYDEENQELILNEELFEKNILKQAMAQALSIKEYLNKNSNKNYFVKPVIVFSSPYASLRFGFNPVNNVIVIGKKFLLEYFHKQPPHFNETEINTLKEALMPLIK